MNEPTADNNNGAPVPSSDLLARAAEVLGVDETGPAGAVPGGRGPLMVTVVGPERRQVMQVPSDVAVGRLAGKLGAAVGVKMISKISIRGGEPVLPDQTLDNVGVRAGSVI